MFTLLTVIRKKPEITTEDFRYFMEFTYGPTYSGLPQTRAYVQYYLSDARVDEAEPAIDAIVQISFDSQEEMTKALQTESYKKAETARERFMQATSVGIHSAIVDKIVKLV
jgi:EthD domain